MIGLCRCSGWRLPLSYGFLTMALVLASMSIAGLASAAATGGRSSDDGNLCSSLDLIKGSDPQTGSLTKRQQSALVIESGAPIYNGPDETSGVSQSMNFSSTLEILAQKQKDGWLQVGLPGTNKSLGWMHSGDLMCGNLPLLDPATGLDRKALLRVEGELDHLKPVPAYPSSSGTACERNHCTELGRYDIQFIVAERKGRVLLSPLYTAQFKSFKLTGWVESDQIFRWNTALGLRPSEALSETDKICAYLSADDASRDRDCRPILGGPQWFLTSTRLPLLEDLQDFYRIAVTSTGVGNVKLLDGSQIKIATDKLQALKQIDVFFVIDGTDSMQGMFNLLQGSGLASGKKLPGIVGQITSQLRDRIGNGASFRFGFRIYRDGVPPAEDKSLGEVFPLSSSNCVGDDNQHSAFFEAFSKVKAEIVPTPQGVVDDYPENMYGGIYKGLDDMAGCRDNFKLMFVIGDAGYDAAKRRQRRDAFPHANITVFETADLIRAMQPDKVLAHPLIGPFFIRMPQDPTVPKTERERVDYQRAYTMFGDEAQEILSTLNATATPDERRAALTKQFITLQASDGKEPLGPEKLKLLADRIADFTQPDAINEITVDLRGGMALKTIIEKYRKSADDVPILFWRAVDQQVCDTLGPQCTTSHFEGVNTLFVRKKDSPAIDVRMTSEQLWKWIIFLQELGGADLPPKSLSQNFGSALVQSVGKAVGSEPTTTGEPITEFLQHVGGLPSRAHSPLMSYSLDDFIKTPPDGCEIIALQDWVRNSANVLKIAERGPQRPDYTYVTGQTLGQCTLSPKGRAIPMFTSTVRPVPLGPDPSYSYMHPADNTNYYWLPQQFMP